MSRCGPRIVALMFCSAMASLSSCARARPELPTGAGTPFPDAAAVYAAAVEECRGARTLRATLGLSGRAGSTRLRGNVDAGFEAPDRIRLEGRHPLGRPVFILVAAGPQATLYFPRDERVMRDVPPDAIVEALVGLPLGPGELRSLVSGCGFGAADAGAGRQYPKGLVAVDTAGAATYVRQQDGKWRVVGATRPPLTVQYADFASGRASTMRVRSSGRAAADLTVRLSDVNINIPLDAAVFAVDVAAAATAMGIEELRRAGPLGGQ